MGNATGQSRTLGLGKWDERRDVRGSTGEYKCRQKRGRAGNGLQLRKVSMSSIFERNEDAGYFKGVHDHDGSGWRPCGVGTRDTEGLEPSTTIGGEERTTRDGDDGESRGVEEARTGNQGKCRGRFFFGVCRGRHARRGGG